MKKKLFNILSCHKHLQKTIIYHEKYHIGVKYKEAQLKSGYLASIEANTQLQCTSKDCQRSTDKDSSENLPFYTMNLLNKPDGKKNKLVCQLDLVDLEP